jgi:Holliday junction DNA helicase RuvA
MIERVRGVLTGIEGQEAMLEPPGLPVTLAVLVPAYLAERLAGKVGESVVFHTLASLESHGQGTSFVPRLIGFLTPLDRAFFELFTTVKGIGTRRALRALAAEPSAIARAIVARDTGALYELPEVGKRLAETIVAELDGKVGRFLSTDELDGAERGSALGPAGTLSGVAAEAAAALVALGEPAAEAERMVRGALALEPKPSGAAALIEAAYRAGR